jgi:hypothetical protein
MIRITFVLAAALLAGCASPRASTPDLYRELAFLRLRMVCAPAAAQRREAAEVRPVVDRLRALTPRLDARIGSRERADIDRYVRSVGDAISVIPCVSVADRRRRRQLVNELYRRSLRDPLGVGP